MSMLVRTGTMVRPKRTPSPRRTGTQPRGYVNPALVPDEQPPSEDRPEGGGRPVSPTPSTSSTRQLLKPREYAADSDDGDTTYGTIFRELQEANSDSTGLCDYLQRIFYIVYTSMLVTVAMGVLIVLPVIMISVGASYISDCPAEPKLPLYLIIGGILGFIKVVLSVWYQVKARTHGKVSPADEYSSDPVISRCAYFTNHFLTLFLFVWFGLGNYWLFSVREPNFEQPLYDPDNWCDKTAYLFTFYQILTIYGMISLVLVLTLCLVIGHLSGKLCPPEVRRDLP